MDSKKWALLVGGLCVILFLVASVGITIGLIGEVNAYGNKAKNACEALGFNLVDVQETTYTCSDSNGEIYEYHLEPLRTDEDW